MRVFIRIFLGLLTFLYVGMFLRHFVATKCVYGGTMPPYTAQVEMHIQKECKYKERCVLFFTENEYVFSPVESGARVRLSDLVQRFTGEEVTLLFYKDHTLLKKGYAIMPDTLDGVYIIFRIMHPSEKITGELTATDDLNTNEP